MLPMRPPIGQLFGALAQPPEVTEHPDPMATDPTPRAGYRAGAEVASANKRTADLLAAQTTPDLLAHLGVTDPRRQVAAGQVLAQVGKRIATDEPHDADPDGQRGVAWDLAALDHALASGAVIDPEARRHLRSLAILTPEEAQAFAAKVAGFGNTARHFASPDHPGQGLALTGARLTPKGATVALAVHDPKLLPSWVANSKVVPVPAIAGRGVRFVRSRDGVAVLGDGTPASAEQVRILYPALPLGHGVHQYAQVRPARVSDPKVQAQRLLFDSSKGEVETVVGLTGGAHVATRAGNHLLVRVDDAPTADHVRRALSDHEVTDYPRSLVQRATNNGVHDTTTATLVARLPDDATPADIHKAVADASAAGATGAVAYTHQPLGAGYVRVQEHHYRGPAGQLVIGRSLAPDPAADNGYTAWMPTKDTRHLAASHPPPSGGDPERRPDGSWLAGDGQVVLHFEHNIGGEVRRARLTGKLWDSTVGGKRTGHFALQLGDQLPELSIGPTLEGAKAGLPGASVTGEVRPDGSVRSITAPPAGDAPDLGVLAEAFAVLRRAAGATVDEDTAVVAPDGSRYKLGEGVT